MIFWFDNADNYLNINNRQNFYTDGIEFDNEQKAVDCLSRMFDENQNMRNEAVVLPVFKKK